VKDDLIKARFAADSLRQRQPERAAVIERIADNTG